MQQIDLYNVFEELLPAVHKTLDAMVSSGSYPELGFDWNWNGDSLTKAHVFLSIGITYIFDLL